MLCFACVIAMIVISINIKTHDKTEKEWIVLLEVLKYLKSMDLWFWSFSNIYNSTNSFDFDFFKMLEIGSSLKNVKIDQYGHYALWTKNEVQGLWHNILLLKHYPI